MQNLWNRAGQAHRCGCRACSTAVNALGRRTTTAASRRKATFAEIFTACYSSMFASAAIIDSMRKDESRRELDKQLEQAKQELAELKEQGRMLGLPHSSSDGLSSKQMDILWKAMKQVYNERPYLKNICYPALVPASRFTNSLLREYYDCPTAEILRKDRHLDYTALEQAIMNETLHCTAPGARTETHLRHETTQFLRLIKALLNEAGRGRLANEESKSYEQAKALLSNNHTGFTFRLLDPKAARGMTQELNESLRQILATGMPLKEKIGRICYNMMVSSHVPDIHTYNTLIAGFDKRGLFPFSNQVISSFFYRRYIQPTKSTFVAMLNHDKLMNKPINFLRSVACITGLDDQTGAKMRRRHVDSLQRKYEESWVTTNPQSKTQTGDYIFEHMSLNRELVEEMMRGLLRFKLFEGAAVLFVACLKSGVVIGSKVLRQLLDECLSALDWSASVQLVRGMSQFGQQWRELMLESGDEGLYLANRVHMLLDLCGISIHGQEVTSMANRLQISESGLSSLLRSLDGMGIYKEPSSFIHKQDAGKSRLLQLESIRKEYVKARKVTTSIESKLLNADHPQEFREDCALHVAESALQRSGQLSQEFAQLLAQRMPVQKQSAKEVEHAVKPAYTFEPLQMSNNQRVAVAQMTRMDRGLAMHWSSQLISRAKTMAENVGFGSA